MISNLRNEVERLRPAHDELAAQMAEFLAAGGEIEEGPSSGYKPKPITYSNQMPPAPKPFVRRRVESAPAEPAPTEYPPIDQRADRRIKQVEQARELSATHTQTEAAKVMKVSPRTLCNMAKELGFSFKKAARGGSYDAERLKQLEARDAQYAERVRAFKELGITRRQVCGRLAIANKTFERIIATHGIDYPKARKGCTSCAA